MPITLPVDTIALPLQPYLARADAITSAAVALDPSHSSFDIKVQRAALPDTTEDVVKCRIELSVDGGLTWSPTPNGEKLWPWGPFPIEFTVPGGAVLDQNGAISTYSSVSCGVKADLSRTLRVLMTPLKSVTTAVEIALK